MIAAAFLLVAAQAPELVYTDVSRREAEQTMAAFLACEVKSKQGHAAALAYTREVAAMPSSYATRLIKSSCAPRGSKLKMNPELVRMSLFPALYARDYGKVAPTLPPVFSANYSSEFDGTPGEDVLTLRRFGDCVVSRDAANSRALTLAKLYSPEEQRAVEALRPALGQCVAEGQQLHFSRTVVRGAVAEALYKMSAAAPAAKAN